MKISTVLFILLFITLKNSYAITDKDTISMDSQERHTITDEDRKGNGGDECKQEKEEIRKKLLQSVKVQMKDFQDHFALEVFTWMLNKASIKIVENFTIPGKWTDAANDPEKKLIELKEDKWCPMSKERKTKILFHEILGLLSLEGTDEYHISDKLVYIDARSSWVCNVPYYYDGRYDDGVNYAPGKGEDPLTAFKNAYAGMHDKCSPCYRVEQYNSFGDYHCVVAPTIVNSCVKTK